MDKSEDILVLTYMGMVTEQLVVGQESTANVSHINADTELDEVIVVGYQSVSKSDLIGSVSSSAIYGYCGTNGVVKIITN